MKKGKIALIIGIVCMLLVIAICIQVRTIKETTQVAVQSQVENDLKDEVFKWKERYDATYKQVEETDKTLKEIREQATKNSDSESQAEEQIKKNNMLLGLTDVKGPGIIITLKDNSSVKASSVLKPELLLIHDGDLRSIINELKNAGAEAIEINGQRIVQTTSIVCDGNVVRVNGEKLGSPFTIKAIGLTERLYNVTRIGGYLENLQDDGINVDVKKSNDISISKYSGVISSKYMERAK